MTTNFLDEGFMPRPTSSYGPDTHSRSFCFPDPNLLTEPDLLYTRYYDVWRVRTPNVDGDQYMIKGVPSTIGLARAKGYVPLMRLQEDLTLPEGLPVDVARQMFGPLSAQQADGILSTAYAHAMYQYFDHMESCSVIALEDNLDQHRVARSGFSNPPTIVQMQVHNPEGKFVVANVNALGLMVPLKQLQEELKLPEGLPIDQERYAVGPVDALQARGVLSAAYAHVMRGYYEDMKELSIRSLQEGTQPEPMVRGEAMPLQSLVPYTPPG